MWRQTTIAEAFNILILFVYVYNVLTELGVTEQIQHAFLEHLWNDKTSRGHQTTSLTAEGIFFSIIVDLHYLLILSVARRSLF